MHLVKIRKAARGELMLAIPKVLADRIRAGYMLVDFQNGRLTYTPAEISVSGAV